MDKLRANLQEAIYGLSSVDLTGELQITDPEKFRQTLFNGLGRAKAFGCGLLMVRRA